MYRLSSVDAQRADLRRLAANTRVKQSKNMGFVVALGWGCNVYRGADRGVDADTIPFLDIINDCGKIKVIC